MTSTCSHGICTSSFNESVSSLGSAASLGGSISFEHGGTSHASLDHKSSSFPLSRGMGMTSSRPMMGGNGSTGMMSARPGMMGPQPGMMGPQPGMMGPQPGMMGQQPGAMGQQPGMGTNPNAPIIFLVPIKGNLGVGGLPKMIQLPNLMSIPSACLQTLPFCRPSRPALAGFM